MTIKEIEEAFMGLGDVVRKGEKVGADEWMAKAQKAGREMIAGAEKAMSQLGESVRPIVEQMEKAGMFDDAEAQSDSFDSDLNPNNFDDAELADREAFNALKAAMRDWRSTKEVFELGAVKAAIGGKHKAVSKAVLDVQAKAVADAARRFTVTRLRCIATLIEGSRHIEEIRNEYLAYSPAGDDMGCDNFFIRFGNKDTDIGDVLEAMKGTHEAADWIVDRLKGGL
jgi:hypothetical protein